TQLVNPNTLTATIPASDLGKPTTALITVVNPAPGGGTSNPAAFSVTVPSTSVGCLNNSKVRGNRYCIGIVAGDFNTDGNADVAVLDADPNNGSTVQVWLGNGDGMFDQGQDFLAGNTSIYTADLNQDGKLDLITSDSAGAFYISLGNGDGTFRPPKQTTTSAGAYIGA